MTTDAPARKLRGFPRFSGDAAAVASAAMAEFLVECYRARCAPALARAAERARASAEAVTCDATPVRYLRSIFVPDDEVCFHLYEAPSAEAAAEAASRAGIVFERVLEAITEPPARRRPASDVFEDACETATVPRAVGAPTIGD